ncbi:MAG: peptidyl-tRNA hydrolase Pth2 [Nanobdellota archaeon]
MKQVILVRMDLKLPKGKLAAQVGHACVEATLKGIKHQRDTVSSWHKEGMKKVVLKVVDEREMLSYMQQAKDEGIMTALITDAGRTIVEPGTRTCLAIGPGEEEKIDRITKKLSLL